MLLTNSHPADAKMEELGSYMTSAYKKHKVKKLKKWIKTFEPDVDASVNEYYTSEVTSLVEDRDIAACAVALVVASARKGVVCLCVNVARILKKNAKLEKQLEDNIKVHANVADTQQLPVINQAEVGVPILPTKLASNPAIQVLQKLSPPLKLKNNETKEIAAEKIMNVNVTNRNVEENLSPTCSDKQKKPFSIVVTTATVHSSSLTEQEQSFPCSAAKHKREKNPNKKCILLQSDNSRSKEAKSSSVPRKSFVKPKRCSSILKDDTLENERKFPNIDEDNPMEAVTISLITSEVTSEKDTCLNREHPPNTYMENYDECELENTHESASYWKFKYLEIYQHVEKLKYELRVLQEKMTALEDIKQHLVESSVQTMDEIVTKPQFVSVATNTSERQGYNNTDDHEYQNPWFQLLSRQHLSPIMAPCPLAGCKCSRCECAVREAALEKADIHVELFQLIFKNKPILEVNAKVMIPGDRVAQVAYIGHLDSTSMPCAVFVGVIINKSEGNSDGCYCGKRYFHCFQNCGIFMPINQILFIINHAGEESQKKKKKPLKKMRSHSHSGRTTFYSH